MKLNIAKLLSLIKGIWVDIIIVIACIGIFIPFLLFDKPVRVGDGSEYYALAIAWSSTHKPFMTNPSWQVYDNLYSSGVINGLHSSEQLKTWFSDFILGHFYDMDHFWFYSFCAAVFSILGNIAGIHIPIQASFLLLHCFLLASMFVIAWRCYGKRGLLAAILLTFLSPMIWYFDKVHTEFFTYCVTTSAVILFFKKRYFLSAFFLALASTQNMSFAPIGLLALGFGFLEDKNKKYTLGEVALLLLTINLFAIQPVYYFFRWGNSYTSYLGISKFGQFIQYSYIWFLDPDIGLFPNWPFGIVLLVIALIGLRGRKLTRLTFFPPFVFVSCYVLISILAQSSTANFNSGATPGLARYALWYLALFFPAVLVLTEKFAETKWTAAIFSALILCGIIYSALFFLPSQPEKVLSPSYFSFWLQKNFPNLYDPPPEIFAERYGGAGETPSLTNTLAVVGPDCHKVLVWNEPSNLDQEVLGGSGCGFDMNKLSQTIKNIVITEKQTAVPVYMWLSDSEMRESRFIPNLGEWYSFASGGPFSQSMMPEGWSSPEGWGTWSVGKLAVITVSCPAIEKVTSTPLMIELDLNPYIAPGHDHTDVKISIDDHQAWSEAIQKHEIIQLELPTSMCKSDDLLSIKFIIENPESPYALGQSADPRTLGIGLDSIRFTIP